MMRLVTKNADPYTDPGRHKKSLLAELAADCNYCRATPTPHSHYRTHA